MKTLYLQCAMGAAGDMLTAALYELLPDKAAFLDTLHHMGLPHVEFQAEATQSCGIAGTHLSVLIHGQEEDKHCHTHHHHHLQDIYKMMEAVNLPFEVIEQGKQVYNRLAAAESKAHACTVEEVHFHEVGALDAVADVLAACYAVHLLSPDQIAASPIHVGSGFVQCANGLLPVPAPATANLLLGVPTYGGQIDGELCTPTGAALLTEFVQRFGNQPMMRVEKIGVGLGKKQFPAPNCLRAFWGNSAQDEKAQITELVCNIDDMTPEAMAYACKKLLQMGALDVYTLPGTMKKGRPGWVLTVLCAPEKESALIAAIFQETSSNGLRVRRCEKYFMRPQIEQVQTNWGAAHKKQTEGFGAKHRKPEYEDVARIAEETGLPFQTVWETILNI